MTVEEKGVGFGYSTPESREGTDCEHHGTVSAIWTPLHQGSNSVWKASKHEWLIILVIAIVSLMVALDATILVTVLPVYFPHNHLFTANDRADNPPRPSRVTSTATQPMPSGPAPLISSRKPSCNPSLSPSPISSAVSSSISSPSASLPSAPYSAA